MEFTWDISPGFVIAGLGIRYYSLIFAFVFLVGWRLFRWQVRRGGGTAADADGFLFAGIFATWLGGRLFHMVFYDFDVWLQEPWIVFLPRQGGIASHGSGLALVVAMWGYTRYRGASFLDGLDRFTPTACLATTMVRLGNFFNSEVVGRVTDQSWGVRFPRFDRGIDSVPLRHPSQLYEFGLGLAVMVLILVVDRRMGERRPRGLMISLFFACYFTGRFLVEYFKEYQTMSPGFPMTMGQLLSILPALAGVVGVVLTTKKRLPAGWRPESSDSRVSLLDDE